MDAADGKLTSTFEEDFADLWKEDVFEAFVWPDERDPLYFEYEISPLGRELPILIPNLDGRFLGWRLWHDGRRSVSWDWSCVSRSFHEFQKFRALEFE
jgi:hypothetical protein